METYDSHKTATEARQANHTHANLWVLLISSVIVIAAFFIIYLVYFAGTPSTAT